MKTLIVVHLATSFESLIAELGRDAPTIYLKSYDVDAADGFGIMDFTASRAEALRFESFSAAMEAWKTQSTVRPLRDDLKPNRPLTALSIGFEEVEA